ncbi:uncharacterized protein [Panulirus ornatus]|uniref:uncharacterized protein n=1 Tax=Panulirus ornatus TaxID=150431 RepID=UPI003A849FB6
MGDVTDDAETTPAAEAALENGGAPEEPPEDLFQQEEKERKVRKKHPRSLWKKPATYVYSDNFGFGVNSYQPMIDYLDAKDDGELTNKSDVHLPLLEERCMTRYHSSKPFKWYENCDIDRYIDKGEKIRTQIRQNDAIGLSNVLRRTHTNWSMTRKWVQLVKNSSVLDYRKLHKKASEFEDARYRPRLPTPIKVLDYRELTPKPRYLDDLSSEFASVVRALAQSREEHERSMAERREKLRELDNKFEGAVDHVYQQMQRLDERAERAASASREPREIVVSDRDLLLRNRTRRQEEMKNMMDHVNDLTEIDSARNTLRASLRALDDEVLGLSGRVDDMWHLQAAERARRIDPTVDLDMLRAEIAARRSRSRAPSFLPEDEDDEAVDVMRFRRPQEVILLPSRSRVTPRPREPLMREEIVSDVVARVLYRAGELGPAVGEQRRINRRARFVNVFKPRPDTADDELFAPPTRTEVNIDHMAKTLASRRACQRRYEIDDEVDLPISNINTNAFEDYRHLRARRPIEEHPSISNRVRHAQHRARARNTLLGH